MIFIVIGIIIYLATGAFLARDWIEFNKKLGEPINKSKIIMAVAVFFAWIFIFVSFLLFAIVDWLVWL